MHLKQLYLRRYLRRKPLHFFLIGIGVFIYGVLDITGILRRIYELDFETEFSYPLDLKNFEEIVTKYRNGYPIEVEPINTFFSDFTYLEKAHHGCNSAKGFDIILLIKSAPTHFEHREAIRSTWGRKNQFLNVKIKTVFQIGRSPTQPPGLFHTFEKSIHAESEKYKDILRGNFVDTYYNNTIKTMLGMRWLVETCPNFQFAFFADDDTFVNVKNLIRFIRAPLHYNTKYLNSKRATTIENNLLHETKHTEILMNSDVELKHYNGKLFAGHVFKRSQPCRAKFGEGSKWAVPLSTYPYNFYPPFVSGGAMMMSKSTVTDLYYSSFYTKPYLFDDVYLAILANKMGIKPIHSEWFKMYGEGNAKLLQDPLYEGYKYIIASHEYTPQELLKMWNNQKILGNV